MKVTCQVQWLVRCSWWNVMVVHRTWAMTLCGFFVAKVRACHEILFIWIGFRWFIIQNHTRPCHLDFGDHSNQSMKFLPKSTVFLWDFWLQLGICWFEPFRKGWAAFDWLSHNITRGKITSILCNTSFPSILKSLRNSMISAYFCYTAYHFFWVVCFFQTFPK